MTEQQHLPYDSLLNHTLQALPPSGIRRFFDIANEMEDVISLSIGEPDFATPWHIREAGIRSLQDKKTWYTPNAGLMELRETIGTYVKRKFDVEYVPKTEILVTVGGSEAIDMALRAVINPGDEVLVPEPSFVCYAPLAAMAGGTAVPIRTSAENAFRLTPEDLREAITPRTKVLILPYPNNPTGGVMRREPSGGGCPRCCVERTFWFYRMRFMENLLTAIPITSALLHCPACRSARCSSAAFPRPLR